LCEAEHVWFIRYHHTVADGYSAALLAARAAEIYSALMAAEPVPESPFGRLPDLIAADGDYRDSDEFERDREYWRARFEGLAEPVRLAGRPGRITGDHRRLGVLLSGVDADGVRPIGRDRG